MLMDIVKSARRLAAAIMLIMFLAACGQINSPDVPINDGPARCEYTYNVNNTFIDVPDEYGKDCTVIVQGDGNTIYTNPDVTIKDMGKDNQIIIKSSYYNMKSEFYTKPVMYIPWTMN